MSDCKNLVCLDQLIEPDPDDTFVVVNNNGSPAFYEKGITPIPQGVSQVIVTFLAEKASLDYALEELQVENTSDPSPLDIIPTVTARGLNSFTASLSATPDSPNYQLRWTAQVNQL